MDILFTFNEETSMSKVSTFGEVGIGGNFGSCATPFGFYLKLEGQTDGENAIKIVFDDDSDTFDPLYYHFDDSDLVVLDKPVKREVKLVSKPKQVPGPEQKSQKVVLAVGYVVGDYGLVDLPRENPESIIEKMHDDYPLIDVMTLDDILDLDDVVPSLPPLKDNLPEWLTPEWVREAVADVQEVEEDIRKIGELREVDEIYIDIGGGG